ncbi:hypothetical protein L3X38_032592 [Prunus dulcis]|uniref:Uncharacterized protein n=1 Tax=Prunus dulcis TaxID=3755 RepID=A0AAD4VED5_PRUDU|nr:hypothetical protein L3X38_032592 [Prunus dulcis]
MKVEEVAAARTEAMEEYKASNEFKNLVLDGMVVEQFESRGYCGKKLNPSSSRATDLALNRNNTFVVDLHSDSQELVNLLKGEEELWCNLGNLVEDVKFLLSQLQIVDVCSDPKGAIR